MSKEIKLIPELRFPEFENANPWSERKLGNVGEFVGGGTPSTSNYQYWDGDIQWYTPTEVKDGVLNPSKRKITEDGLKNSSAKLLPIGTILITTRATIGDVAIANQECTTNQGFQSLIVKETEVNLFWYYWIILHKHELVRRSSGSTFKEIGKSEIKVIPTLSPRKEEQQKIAFCLSSLDELLAAHNDKLDALKDHKKGLMQNLFPQDGETMPKVRFPGFEGDGEWEKVALEKIAHKIMVGIASAATHAYRKSGIILFRNQNIKEGYLDDKDILYIDEEYEKAHKNKRLKGGDLLTARTGYPGTTCMVPDKYEGSQSFTTLITRPNKKFIDSAYLCFYLNSETGQAFFNSTKIGGGQKNVNAGSLSVMPIPLPSEREQQKIASCLSALDALIMALTEKIEQLQQYKKGLMQGLFPKIES